MSDDLTRLQLKPRPEDAVEDIRRLIAETERERKTVEDRVTYLEMGRNNEAPALSAEQDLDAWEQWYFRTIIAAVAWYGFYALNNRHVSSFYGHAIVSWIEMPVALAATLGVIAATPAILKVATRLYRGRTPNEPGI